jgi:hypothetical protein
VALIPTGYAQINWKFTGTSCPNGAEVTLGVDISSYGGTPAAAAGDAIVAYNDNIDGIMPATVTLASVLVKFGPNATGPSAESPSGNAGSGGGASTSPNVAWLVHKTTAQGGRAGRGRMYWPGVQESEVDPSGNLSTAFVTGAQTAVDGFLADLSTALLIPVVLHGAASPLSTPTTILSLEVDGVAATQRRRMRG